MRVQQCQGRGFNSFVKKMASSGTLDRVSIRDAPIQGKRVLMR